MFVIICTHCNKEAGTRTARLGATVKCMSCQQTYVLGNLNISEIPDPQPLEC